MKDVIRVDGVAYTLEEFDAYFERAIQEGERSAYENRQLLLSMMQLRPGEEGLYKKLMGMQMIAAMDSRINPEQQKKMAVAAREISKKHLENRYWQYVYAKQSEAYFLALQEAGIDLDAAEPIYDDIKLVGLFRKHFILLEIKPPSLTLPGCLQANEKLIV